jgi:glutamate dehydrogenase
MYTSKKYVEYFANGMVIVSLDLRQLPHSRHKDLRKVMPQLVKEISLLFLLPVFSLHELFLRKELSVMETTYAYAAWLFSGHFLNRLGHEYESLANMLDLTRDDHLDILSKAIYAFNFFLAVNLFLFIVKVALAPGHIF